MDDFVTLLDADGIRRALSRISYEIVERAGVLTDVVLVGIRTRGWYIAQRLAKRVAEIEHVEVPYFALDISRYRDDRRERPDASTNSDLLPERINEKRVVLIDDVLFTGRTARAGLDALTDGARPARIQLAVLVDRGHRELPIRPDYIGKNIPTARSERVDVRLSETDGEDIVRLRK